MKQNSYKFALLYIFVYSAMGAVFPLIGQYLMKLGFTGTQIGIITASATAIGIVAAPFWGSVYHKTNNSKRVVLSLCFAAVIVPVLLLPISNFSLFLIGYIILFFFQIPICPLIDTMTLEENHGFGSIRKWGAVGYAGGVFIAGQLAAYLGLHWIFIMFSMTSFAAGIMVLFIMRAKTVLKEVEHQNDIYNKQKTVSIPKLLCNKKYIAILLSAFFVMGTNIANNTFFGFLYTNGGGTISGIGLVFLFMAGSEAPCMAWVHRFSNRFTLERMILFAMILSACRFFWYGTGPSAILLMATFFLQGIVNGILLIEFIRYAAKVVDVAFLGLSMTLIQAISCNGSTILCQLIGGYFMDRFGSGAVYIGFAIMNLLGVLVYLSFGLHKKPQENFID
ncbi:MAG: MFS transporter [Anaerovorax sp.]|nr:MFS transporter [Anaerovorax sp.]